MADIQQEPDEFYADNHSDTLPKTRQQFIMHLRHAFLEGQMCERRALSAQYEAALNSALTQMADTVCNRWQEIADKHGFGEQFRLMSKKDSGSVQ